MTIAVTGADGFIGRHVVAELVRRRIGPVVAVSRRAAGPADRALPVDRVALDLAEPAADAFERLGRPEVLIHLAWEDLSDYGSFSHFERQLPLHDAFLAAVLKAGLRRLVCTGTCFEYGMRNGELDEAMVPDPANPYAFAKNALRSALDFRCRHDPFELVWARLFYLHGDGQAERSLHAQWRAAHRRGDPVFRMSPGDQLRDYLPVEAVARNLVALAVDTPPAGVVNVCSGVPVSVRSLVEGWIRDSGATMALELGHYPYAAHEARAFWGSRAKLDRLLAGIPNADAGS